MIQQKKIGILTVAKCCLFLWVLLDLTQTKQAMTKGASKMEKERERKKQDGEIYVYPFLVHRIDINPRFQLLMQARPLALT